MLNIIMDQNTEIRVHKVKTNKTQLRFPIIFSILNTAKFNLLQILCVKWIQYGLVFTTFFFKGTLFAKIKLERKVGFWFLYLYIKYKNPTNLISISHSIKFGKKKNRGRKKGRRKIRT